MWFTMGRQLDPIVSERFADTVHAALAGELDDWADTDRGRLALIIVLDQFTRHVFRDDPRFVAGDPHALRHAKHLLERLDDLADEQVLFVLTVLEHQEDRAVQDLARRTVRELAASRPALAELVAYVDEHADIIDRFGRFPDRNHLLRRPSTPEEVAFLASEHRAWFERQPANGPKPT